MPSSANTRRLFDSERTRVVRAAGDELDARIEKEPDPERVDHVWIGMNAGIGERVRVAVNTCSLKSRAAGVDDRVRVGVVRGHWETLPGRGVEEADGLDYAKLEAAHNIYYEPHTRAELEATLMRLCANSLLLEVWGAPYRRGGAGIHQVHSRRASTAVPEDLSGMDGALRFYFERHHGWKMLLLKFHGQP